MRTFMLIGVSEDLDADRKRKAHCVCHVRAETSGDAAAKLCGASYPGMLRNVFIASIVGTYNSNYVIFHPGKATGTVLEAAIAKLDGNVERGAAFGDYLKRYTDWVLVEVATVI